MTTGTRYPQEVRERATRMVFEHQGEHHSQWAAVQMRARGADEPTMSDDDQTASEGAPEEDLEAQRRAIGDAFEATVFMRLSGRPDAAIMRDFLRSRRIDPIRRSLRNTAPTRCASWPFSSPKTSGPGRSRRHTGSQDRGISGVRSEMCTSSCGES